MNTTFAIIATAIAIVVVASVIQHYMRRSMRWLGNATLAWEDVSTAARKIIRDKSYPLEIVNLANGLALRAGCGCFVRGVLWQHFAPPRLRKVWLPRRRNSHAEDVLVRAITGLSWRHKQELNNLFFKVVLFDSFYNPLWGVLLRRTASNYKNVTRPPAPEALQEVKEATISVVSRQQTEDLCIA